MFIMVYFGKLIEFMRTNLLELLDCAMLYFNLMFSQSFD
jgi:hypothetical protein